MKKVGIAEAEYDNDVEWLEDTVDQLHDGEKYNLIMYLFRKFGMEEFRDYFDKEYNRALFETDIECEICGKNFEVDQVIYESGEYDRLCEECAEEIDAELEEEERVDV